MGRFLRFSPSLPKRKFRVFLDETNNDTIFSFLRRHPRDSLSFKTMLYVNNMMRVWSSNLIYISPLKDFLLSPRRGEIFTTNIIFHLAKIFGVFSWKKMSKLVERWSWDVFDEILWRSSIFRRFIAHISHMFEYSSIIIVVNEMRTMRKVKNIAVINISQVYIWSSEESYFPRCYLLCQSVEFRCYFLLVPLTNISFSCSCMRDGENQQDWVSSEFSYNVRYIRQAWVSWEYRVRKVWESFIAQLILLSTAKIDKNTFGEEEVDDFRVT